MLSTLIVSVEMTQRLPIIYMTLDSEVKVKYVYDS